MRLEETAFQRVQQSSLAAGVMCVTSVRALILMLIIVRALNLYQAIRSEPEEGTGLTQTD